MSELASLENSLLDLLSKLDSTTFPIILGGGYGLYLRRTILEREATRIIAMITESEWKQAIEMANANADSEIGREAHGIVFKMFDSLTSRGMLVMRANPYCSDKLQLAEFIELIRELF